MSPATCRCDNITKIGTLAVITQCKQTYASCVKFDSFIVFMHLFRSKNSEGKMYSLQPLKGDSVWPFMLAMKRLQAASVIYDH